MPTTGAPQKIRSTRKARARGREKDLLERRQGKIWLVSQVDFQILPEQKSIFQFNRLVYFLFWRLVFAIDCHRRGNRRGK